MSHGHLYFEIHSEDTSRAMNFYKKAFGWEFTKHEFAPVEYYRIETGGTAGGLLKRTETLPEGLCAVNAFVCSFEVEDFDEIQDLILENGGKIEMPKFAVPNLCWTGYYIDTEGNTFGLFQADLNAGN